MQTAEKFHLLILNVPCMLKKILNSYTCFRKSKYIHSYRINKKSMSLSFSKGGHLT